MFRITPDSSQKNTMPLVFLALLAFVMVVFWSALDNEFIDWDDNLYLLNNQLIRSLSPSNLYTMFTTLEPVYWHPVTWLSHAIDYQLFGMNPAGHHLVSIVLHGVNAFLVFLLIHYFVGRAHPDLKTSTAAILVSAWVALLFAVHPLRVESVVWATERKDLLGALFLFAALLAYTRYVDAGSVRERRRHYGWMLAWFLLSLMSKPMAVTLPAVLLLLDVYPFNRIADVKSFWKRVWEKAPLFVMSLLCGLLTILAQKLNGSMVPVDALGFGRRAINAMQSCVFYIEKTLWPHPLVPLYPIPALNGQVGLRVAAFFLICVFCYLKWREGKKYWAIAWLWFLITVAPVIGIVQVGGQGAADRFTYIPTLSFYILFAAGAVHLIREQRARGREVVTSMLIGYFAVFSLGVSSILTIRQIPVWRNTGVFWENVIAHFPNQLVRAHANLGLYYSKKGKPDRAMVLFRQAMTINPNYALPFNYLALIHFKRREFEKAEPLFRIAQALEPNPIFENNLGLLYLEWKDLPKAEEWLRKAIRSNPENVEAYNNLGVLFQDRDRLDQAESYFKKAIEIDFDFTPAHANLGNLYRKRNHLEPAITEFSLAVYLEPDNAEIHHSLALALMEAGYLEKAHLELEETLRLNPAHPHARNNLQLVRQHLGSKT